MATLNTSRRAFDSLSSGFLDVLGYTNQRSIVSNNRSGLCYPIELLSDAIDFTKRPVVVFYCNGRKNSFFGDQPTYITFPIPIGLEFNDGASYDDTSLGAIGSALTRVVGSAGSTSNAAAAMDAAINSAKDQYGKFTKSSIRDLVTNVVQKSALSEGSKNIASIGLQSIVNPNVVTEFTGTGTRAFGFKFKMIASSRKEADMIRDICHIFRLSMYPEGNAVALRYPPTWTIRFMLNGSDLEHVPKLFECYLTSVNTSYNSSGTTWHDDGTPLECDLSISFKETRALTADDIDKLHRSNVNAIKFNEYVAPQDDAASQSEIDAASALNTNNSMMS